MEWKSGLAALAPEAQRAWIEKHVDDVLRANAELETRCADLEGKLADARRSERARVMRALERVLVWKTEPKMIDAIVFDVMDELAKEEEARR